MSNGCSMGALELQVIVYLLSLNAGFLAIPFTEWLCETIASAFDTVRGMFRRKPKPKPRGVHMVEGAYWAMWGVSAAALAEALHNTERRGDESPRT